MRLDRLLAEEQLGSYLRIRLTVHDEPRELELPCGQRFEPGSIRSAWPGATVNVMAEPAQLALRLVPVAQCAALLELTGRLLQLGGRAVVVAGLRERSARERAR